MGKTISDQLTLHKLKLLDEFYGGITTRQWIFINMNNSVGSVN